MSNPILAKVLLDENAPISAAMEVIERFPLKIALVVAPSRVLLGTVTDGDVRRALLRGETADSPVSRAMNRSPISLPLDQRHRASQVMAAKKIMQVPLIDAEGRIVDISVQGVSLPAPKLGNTVVIMAGGEGKRLRPFTELTPKPMLRVGGKPMLEIIIDNFARAGFSDFVVSVNYRADTIKDYFGDGDGHGVGIRYLSEPEPRGTAGALRLLDPRPSETFIVVNGDVLTNLNFLNLIEFHRENDALLSLAVQRYRHTIPLGVVDVEGEFIRGIKEKPTLEFFVNAGIYALEPQAIEMIPPDIPFDMPSLVDLVLAADEPVAAFPIHEYWIDVGHAADFTRATMEYDAAFG